MKRKRKKRVTWSLLHLRWRAYNAQRGLCYWCKQPMKLDAGNDPLTLTADHLVPIYAGGKTEPGNIVAACRKCNSSRQEEANMPKREEAVTRAGDDTPRSPFAILAKMLES